MAEEGIMNASIEDIRGSMFYMTVTYDNGYSMKISGELMPGATFIAYKSGMLNWLPPHENEPLTPQVKEKIIKDVTKDNDYENRVTIKFQ